MTATELSVSAHHVRVVSSLQLCKLLYLWALEPAERDAVVAREAVEGGVTVAGYRALVEVFTRRKQDQLFFTKQAYTARFRRNLDQDMVTEPSHPYQRACAHRSSLLFSVAMVLNHLNSLPSLLFASTAAAGSRSLPQVAPRRPQPARS